MTKLIIGTNKSSETYFKRVAKRFRLAIAAFLVTGLTSAINGCGNGSDVAGNGGIGGSGMTAGSGGGEISAFGSVIFNDSTFEVNDATIFTIDGIVVGGQSDLGVGMIATYEIGEDASPGLTSGTAQRIDATTALKGIVTSVNPLRVLGQIIETTGSTILEDIPGGDLANLTTSDLVEVYGIADNNNVFRATRIEYKTASGLVEWKLTGVASNVTPTSLDIGAQPVDINGVTIDDCAGGLSNGDFVEIKASPNTGFNSASTLSMVTEVECETRSIPVPSNPSSTVIAAEFEGIVSGYTGAGDFDFFLSEQLVEFSGSTEFEDGSIADLEDGVRVEVEGLFNTSTLVLSATEIEFEQTRIKITAPVNLGDVMPGQSIDILGLTVLGTAFTDDEDNILSSATGLPAQVEVEGFVDGNGDIYAEDIKNVGSVDTSDIDLQGPIANLANPSLTILGLPVNLNGAAGYLDLNGNPVADVNAFFGLISSGDIIEVEDAVLNAGPNITMDAVESTVEIED